MKETNGFKELSQMEMKTRLEEMGAYKQGSVWRIPRDVFPTSDLNKSDNVVKDFDLHEGESNDF